MAFKKRRLIQAISDRVPDDQDSLLEAVKKEVWPFLKQVRRLIFDATGGSPDPGGTQVVVNEGDTTVINTTINPSPFDDHLVKARTVDQTPVGGLIEKTKAGRKVQISLMNDNGVEKALFDVIEQPVDVTRRYLRLAGIVDPNLRAPVRGVAASGSGGGAQSGRGGGLMVGLVFDYWSQVGGAAGTWTWRCGFNGVLQLYSNDQSVPCKKDDRILVTRELKLVLNGGYSYEAVDSAYPGIYEVLDPGSESTPPVIRRVQDANTADEFYIGTVVQVTGEPKADFYGKYFRFDAAGAISVDLTNVTCDEYAYVAPEQRRLLTDSEFAAANLDPVQLYDEWDVTNGEGWNEDFTTSVGVPGVSEIPSGTQRFYCPAVWVEGWNPGANPGDVFFGYRVTKVPVAGDPVVLFDAYDSAPVTNTVGAPRWWQFDTASISLTPTDQLRITPIASSTCQQAVTIHMLWNQPVDSPYWASTMQIPSANDPYDHDKLINRGIENQHPTLAITPAPQELVTITAGVMPVVTYGSWANVTSASASLDAMDAADFPDYGEREVYFAVGCKLRSDQATTGTNRPIRTYKGTASVYQDFTARAGATVRFRYRPDLGTAGMWLVTGVQQG